VTSRERRKKGNVVTKIKRNLPLLTYSALADFLREGECGDEKREKMTNDEGRIELDVKEV